MTEDSHHQLEMTEMSQISPPPVTSSSSSSTFLQPPAPQLMPIQLTYYNYLLWKSLFIPVLEAYDMLNLAERREQCPPQFLSANEEDDDNKQGSSENVNPAYTSWIKRDKMLLTWINASLSPNLLRHTQNCTSGQALWLHLENLLALPAESHVLGLKAQLQNLDTRRYRYSSNLFNNMTYYLNDVQVIADELEKAGSAVNERELVSHIIQGLHPPYDELVSSIRNPPHPITLRELRVLLVDYDFKLYRERSKRHDRWLLLRILGFILFVAVGTFLMVRYSKALFTILIKHDEYHFF